MDKKSDVKPGNKIKIISRPFTSLTRGAEDAGENFSSNSKPVEITFDLLRGLSERKVCDFAWFFNGGKTPLLATLTFPPIL